MNLVEQAVFTSAETSQTAGYQLVAKSEGVSEDDARALSTWGPSHEALLKTGYHCASINFHPLPSGNFCVGRTTASGNEYSGRGTRIYTQSLIVSPEILAHFANNPFAVIRAASGSGLLKEHQNVPKTLESAALVGRAPAVDPAVLTRARREFGPQVIACLVQAALTSNSMAVAGTSSGELAVAALLNCLPPRMRPEFSFSTALRASARRPYRLLALGTDSDERRRARQIDGLALFDLTAKFASKFPPTDAWARAIQQLIEAGRTSLLGRWFEKHTVESTADQLNASGQELLEELQDGLPAAQPANRNPEKASSAPFDQPAGGELPETSATSAMPASRQLAHAAHSRFSGTSAAQKREPGPSGALAAEHPEVVASLESLDDLVYEAIKGDSSCLAQFQAAWPQVKAELGEALLAQSREQYLRYALHVWEKCVEESGFRPTDRAVNALEVLCLLFDEA